MDQKKENDIKTMEYISAATAFVLAALCVMYLFGMEENVITLKGILMIEILEQTTIFYKEVLEKNKIGSVISASVGGICILFLLYL